MKISQPWYGDPAQITIAGGSAGAMPACALLASPLTKDMTSKAIASSGAIFARPIITLKDAEILGVKKWRWDKEFTRCPINGEQGPGQPILDVNAYELFSQEYEQRYRFIMNIEQ